MDQFPDALHIAVNGWFAHQEAVGSGQYLDHLLDYLPRQAAARGLPIRFSVIVPPHATSEAARRWPGIDLIPISLPKLPRHWQKLCWEQILVPSKARRLEADVLWVPYWAAPLWQPVPVAVTIHDLIPCLLPAYRGGSMQQTYTRLVSQSARRAAAVITVSHASARDITEHLAIPPARIHVIYHGPNREDSSAPTSRQRSEVCAKYGLPDRFFLYLGGFDVRKNVPAVIRAYARYLELGGEPSIRLVIAGQLPAQHTDFTPDPRNSLDDLGLHDLVTFCGWVDDADKPAIYAQALAFLFPSLYEGFGMPLLEAMSAGTPVITSDR